MKQELSKEKQIEEAIQDLEKAMVDNLRANQKIIEVNREKTKTHYILIKAKERLWTLEQELND